ncbi:MAG TPA: DUF2125 domain-containing protein [Paracoccus sp. (in: a-proteobacteria)]|nr:DUF2125 domain-containing protein [Paracoccus sp. (in: a-proteobacteria)]
MFSRMTSSAIAILALTGPAPADVTPAEVWQGWLDYYRASGYRVTEGSRNDAGGTLTLKDVVFTSAADDEGRLVATVPEIALAPTGDGKVRTTLSDTATLALTIADEEDGPVDIAATATMPGYEVVTSGSAGDMTHDGRLPELVLTVDSVKSGTETITAPITFKLLDTAFQVHSVAGDVTTITSDTTANRAEIAGRVESSDPAEPGHVTFQGALDGLQARGEFTMPKGVDMNGDVNAALKAGMAATGSLSVGGGSLDFDFAGQSEGQPQTGTGKLAGQGFTVGATFSARGLGYQGDSDGFSAEITSSDLPFPVNYSTESSSFDIQMPVMASDTPVPFKLAYSIGGLRLGDAIWDLFDAGRKLPRDPASLDLDITGMTRVTMDLFDPANFPDSDDSGAAGETAADPGTAGDQGDPQAGGAAPGDGAGDVASGDTAGADGMDAAEAGKGDMPFEPTEMTINKLALAAAGASLDASGALTVPEGGSMDAPVGKVSATILGANGLLDKLVELGAIGPDEVTGYRMMLALFARAAPEGGDKLVSDLEFREGGQVFANGQQVK